MPPLRIATPASFDAQRLRTARRWKNALPAACGTDSCDAVLIPESHDGLARDAIHNAVSVEKHLLLESFAELSPEVFAELQRRLQSKDRRLLAGNPLRFHPSTATVHEMLRSGKLGRPGILRLHDWRPVEASEAVFATRTVSRTVLRMHADLACWMFDAQPELVYACVPREQADGPADCLMTIHLGFDRGGMALIDIARNLPPGDRYWSLSLIGSTGAAYADDHRNRQLLFGGGIPRAECTTEGDLPLLRLQQALIDALAEGTDCLSEGDVRRADLVAGAIEQSLLTGQSQRRLQEGKYGPA